MSRPKSSSSFAEKELDKAAKQFDKFHEDIKEMTLDNMNKAPKLEEEPQTRLSSKEIEKSKEIYLKPIRTLASREKFNEKFRKDWEFAKEYVQFVAENKEVLGEDIDLWTKPFPGVDAEEWRVPVNKPVWGPRYLAEQIKKASYHRLVMDESKINSADGSMQYYGAMTVQNTIQRLDAHPVSGRKSIFMGATNF